MKRQHIEVARECHDTVVASSTRPCSLHWQRGKSQRILSDDEVAPTWAGSSGSSSSRSSRENYNESFHPLVSMQFAQDVTNVLIESVNGLFGEDDDDEEEEEEEGANGNAAESGAAASNGSNAPPALQSHNSGVQGSTQEDVQDGGGPQRSVADGDAASSSSTSAPVAAEDARMGIWATNSVNASAEAAGAATRDEQRDESSDDEVEIVGVIGANTPSTSSGIRRRGTSGPRHVDRLTELFVNVNRPTVDDLSIYQSVEAYRTSAPELYSDEAPRHLNIGDVRNRTSAATGANANATSNNNNEGNRNNVVVVEVDDDEEEEEEEDGSNNNNGVGGNAGANDDDGDDDESDDSRNGTGSFYDRDDVEIIGFRHSDTRPPLFAAVPANIGRIDPRFVEEYLNVLRRHSQFPHDSTEAPESSLRDASFERQQQQSRDHAHDQERHVQTPLFASGDEHVIQRHINAQHWSTPQSITNPVQYHAKRRANSIYNQVDTELGPSKKVNSIEDVDFLFTCPICYSTIARFKNNKNPGENDRVVYSTKCGHIFCFDCIEGVKRRRECPICRKPVREKSHYHVLYP